MAGMKNSSKKNTYPIDEKKLMVSTRHKIVSTTQNEVSVKKYVCTIWKTCFLWEKKLEMVYISGRILFC